MGALLAAAPSSKHADQLASRESIPVHIYGGFLVVVEGQIGGALQHQNFVVDTGTSPSILNLRVARELGLSLSSARLAALGQESEICSGKVPELSIGPLEVESAPFLVTDLSAVEHHWNLPIAGILGLDVLGKRSFRLDYQNQRLEFGEVSGEGIAVDFSGQQGLAITQVNIQGKPFRLLVDTGAERLVLFGNKPAAKMTNAVNRKELPGNGVAGAVPARALTALEFNWNGQRFRKDVVLIADRQEPLFDGLLSVRALGFRALAFDAESQTVYLQK
jgi:predicted aspartyl protease